MRTHLICALTLLLGSASLAQAQSEEQGIYGQYYAAGNFRSPTQVRIDENINFNWSQVGPFQESMDMELRERNNNFRVRWSGYITPNYTETYTFATRSDDGIRVWVDDRLVIDNWTNHAPRFDYGVIQLVEGTLSADDRIFPGRWWRVT